MSPFHTKIGSIRDKFLGGDLVPHFRQVKDGQQYSKNLLTRRLFVQQYPKWKRIGKAHLSYYASAYNRVVAE